MFIISTYHTSLQHISNWQRIANLRLISTALGALHWSSRGTPQKPMILVRIVPYSKPTIGHCCCATSSKQRPCVKQLPPSLPSPHLLIRAPTKRSRSSRPRHHEGITGSRHPTQTRQRHQRRRRRSREQSPRNAIIRRSFPPSPKRSMRKRCPSRFIGGDGRVACHCAQLRCEMFGLSLGCWQGIEYDG